MPLHAARNTYLVALGAGLLVVALLFVVVARYGDRIKERLTRHEVTVVIPEGLTAHEIDAVLAAQRVTEPGALASLVTASSTEGYLFPDTYRFFAGTSPQRVMEIMVENFDTKTAALFSEHALSTSSIRRHVILASLLEREVTSQEDRRIVAGILERRLAASHPLQVDATICYLKKSTVAELGKPCYPLAPLDFKMDSPYNTYLYKGLPPGPIGNPGLDALTASVNAQASPYWFYLTDPATKRTIFSQTLEEHEGARERYLHSS